MGWVIEAPGDGMGWYSANAFWKKVIGKINGFSTTFGYGNIPFAVHRTYLWIQLNMSTSEIPPFQRLSSLTSHNSN